MKLTRQSLVRKCLLKSKMEVYMLYKRIWSNQETGSRNKGVGQLQVKLLENILVPSGA
jgi:hypothetical protein